MSLGSMSHVNLKKSSCCSVEFKDQEPLYMHYYIFKKKNAELLYLGRGYLPSQATQHMGMN